MGYSHWYNIETERDDNKYDKYTDHLKIPPCRGFVKTNIRNYNIILDDDLQYDTKGEYTCNNYLVQTDESCTHLHVQNNVTIFLYDKKLQETLYNYTESIIEFNRLRSINNDIIKHNGVSITTRLLLFIQFICLIIDRLLKIKLTREIIPEGKSFILAFDLVQLKTYFNSENYNSKTYQCHQLLTLLSGYKGNQLMIADAPNKISMISEYARSKFDISNEYKYEGTNMTVCKYLTCLSSVYSFILKKYNDQKPPSFCVPFWPFRNISQGYLLGILLRNANVNTLNIMRNFYYIIITSDTRNLNIKINFNIKYETFMVHNNQLGGFSLETLIWNQIYREILKTPYSAKVTWNVIHRICFLYKENQHKSIGRNEWPPSDSNIIIACSMQNLPKKILHSIFLLNQYCILDRTTSTAENINIPFSMPMIGLFHRYIDAIDIQRRREATLTSKIFEEYRNTYSVNFQHSKKWLSKLFNESNDKINSCRNMNSHNIFNKTIFETASITKQMQKLTNVLYKHLTSQTFYKVCLESLGPTLINTMYSVVLDTFLQ